ncbi:MAG: FG-GAP-like repeat-containing protein [Proteobacteria bacterium]|nr:FG-GAP-like repeat-containing protein [Pseudomonadota bacterium]
MFAYIVTLLLLCMVAPSAFGEGKSAVEPQVLSLPKGPGSIEGLGESFEPQLNTGTAAYRVKLAVPPGINKHQPALALVYNSGYGNSPLGLGWRLNVPSIQRQTDKGLPAYTNSDTFIHSEAGELVPMADGSFRLKIEGAFMKFQRNTDGWEVWEKNGIHHYFGTTSTGRLDTSLGTFAWQLDKSVDNYGNVILYIYEKDGGQVYLKEIRYGLASDAVYQSVHFLYEARPDAFTDYHSRSKVLTARRLSSIEMRSRGQLVRKYRLSYYDNADGYSLSLLSHVTQIGSDGTSTLPPMSFGYSRYFTSSYQIVAMTNPPPVSVSLTNTNVDLIDIDGDSLPDMLYTYPGNGHRFYLNQGRGAWQYEVVIPSNSPPHNLSSAGVMMSDMNGDGLADLYIKNSNSSGYYKNRGMLSWEENDWTRFNVNSSFSFDDSRTRLVDLNNDKRIDVIRDSGSSYLIWLNPKNGLWNTVYDNITRLPNGSHLGFDKTITRLGDMNGDRIDDLMHVQSGYVSYFPGKGFGEFDNEVALSNPPYGLGVLAENIDVSDLDNDGLADLVLVENTHIRVWFNNGKGGFNAVHDFQGTPNYIQGYSAHRFADMDGDGFRDLLITNENSANRYQYVSFNQGTHPNLLTRISNGLGMETTIDYKSSTVDYLADRDAGKPWAQKLPFPVQVVSKVTVKDALSGQAYVTDYHYRDGYYDGVEKEFRGFGEVVKHEYGGQDAPGLLSLHGFDVGKEYESRKGMTTSLALLTESGGLNPLQGVFEKADHSLTTRTLLTGTNGQAVTHSFTSATRAQIYELTTSPKMLLKAWDQDAYGNITQEFDYGLVEGDNRAAGKDEVLTTTQYRYDSVKWIMDRPNEIRKTGLDGGFVNLQKLSYDGNGGLTVDERSPDGTQFIPIVRNEFDVYGNIIRITDANGHSRGIDYDSTFHALPVKETINGLNLVMQADYDLGLGVLTRFTDPNRQNTAFQYDTFGRLSAIVKPGDSAEYPTQQFSYQLASPISQLQTRSREESGKPGTYDTLSYFDGLGRKLQTRSEAESGQWVVSEAASFNPRKGIQRQWLPYFDTSENYTAPGLDKPNTLMAYDARSRSIQETNPDGSFRRTVYSPLEKVQYDEEDNRTGGAHIDTPNSSLTDGRNRLVEVRERNGADTYTTRYAYDGLDNLVKITDHEGNIKTLQFDGLGRKTAMDDPDKGTMVYRYDDVGNLLSSTDAKNQTVSYAYDAANRIVTESHQGTVKVRHHYDADLPNTQTGLPNTLGRLAWVEDEAGSESYAYDARGRITRQTRQLDGLQFSTGMDYDALDRLTGLTYPDRSRVEYRYNAMNKLESVPGYVNNIDYTPTGQKVVFEYANGVQSTYAYDTRQRMNRLSSQKIGLALQDLAYSYDQSNNISHIADQRSLKTPEDRSTDYAYDDLYRLTQANAAPLWAEQYRYNPIGNMTFKSDLGNMGYGAGNAGPHALTNAGTTVYGYDGNGNLASKPGFAYQFDAKDRLARVDRAADGAVIQYAYDYNHQRKRKTVSVGGKTETTLYVDRYTEVRPGKLVKNIFAGDRLVARVMVSPFDPASLTGGAPHVTAADLDVSPKDGVISVNEIRSVGGSGNALSPAVIADVLRLYQDSHDNLPGLISFATLAQLMHETDKSPLNSVQAYFYLPDHLGSASVVTDPSGNVVEQSVFYPYGKDRVHLGDFNSEYRFTGKELDDETGLHYFGARYYDSSTGRFVSVDPFYIEAKDIKSLNTTSSYYYTNNKPSILIDKDGLFEEPFFAPLDYETANAMYKSTYINYTLASKWHYEDREAFNKPYEDLTYDQVSSDSDNWTLLPPIQSVEHDNKIGKQELKYIHNNGSELVFDGDTHELITDPKYRGTYNYINPASINDFDRNKPQEGLVIFIVANIGHVIADYIPAKVFGNKRNSN